MARYWRRWAGVRRWPARRAFNCAQGLDDVPDVPTCPRAAAARTRPMQRAARPVHARNSTRSILNRNPEAFNPGAPTSLVTEREGFEPSTHLSARTRFPVALLRPLGHLSEGVQVSVWPQSWMRAISSSRLIPRTRWL